MLYMYCVVHGRSVLHCAISKRSRMDKLCGVVSSDYEYERHYSNGCTCMISQGSLQVVSHKFSNGVQVVRCVLDFFKVS